MVDLDKAIKNPSSIFKNPFDIVKSDELSRDQKIKILESWRYDAKQMSVANEENMTGSNNDILSKILEALKILGVTDADHKSQPTK